MLAAIFQGAFGGTAAAGGFTGAAVAQAIQMGMARSVYSNEGGWGTSPMVHSTAKVNHPVKQGVWGAFEVLSTLSLSAPSRHSLSSLLDNGQQAYPVHN